jgi:hypothetical protein
LKRAFILRDARHLASALVPKETPNVVTLGSRIILSRPVDLGYAAQLASGERGTVDYIDEVSGTIEVLMDRTHRGLHAWFNHIWLEPFCTEDVISAVELLPLLSRCGVA